MGKNSNLELFFYVISEMPFQMFSILSIYKNKFSWRKYH